MKWDLGSGLTAEAAPNGAGLRVLVMLGDVELARYDVDDVASMDAVIDAIVAVASGDAPAAPAASPAPSAEDDFGGAPAMPAASAATEDDFGGGVTLLEPAVRDEWEIGTKGKLSLVMLAATLSAHQREHGPGTPWKAWAESTSSDILRTTFTLQVARPVAGGKPLPSGFRAGPPPGSAMGEEYKCEASITEARGFAVEITQNVGADSRDVNISTDATSLEEVCAATREVLYHPRVALYLSRFDIAGDGNPEIVGTVTTEVVRGVSKLLVDPLVLPAPQTLQTAADVVIRRLGAAGYMLSSPLRSELSSEAIEAAAARAAQGEVLFAPLVLVEPKGTALLWEITLVAPTKILTGDELLKIAERAAPGHAMEQKRVQKHGSRWNIQTISGHSLSVFKRVKMSLAKERVLLGAVWATATDAADLPEGHFLFDDKRRGFFSLPELRAVWELPSAAPATKAPEQPPRETVRAVPADIANGVTAGGGSWPEVNVELRDPAEFAPKVGTARVLVSFPDTISVEFFMANERDGAVMAKRLADVWADVYEATRGEYVPGAGSLADVQTRDCQRSLFGEVCENRVTLSLRFSPEGIIGYNKLKRLPAYSASVEWRDMTEGDQRECAAGFALYFDAMASFFNGVRAEITSVGERHVPLILPVQLDAEPYFANPSVETFRKQFAGLWSGAAVVTAAEIASLWGKPATSSEVVVVPAPSRPQYEDAFKPVRLDGGGNEEDFRGVYTPGALCVVWFTNRDLIEVGSPAQRFSLAWLRESVHSNETEERYLVLDFLVSRPTTRRLFEEDESVRDSLSVIYKDRLASKVWSGNRTFPRGTDVECQRVLLPASEVCVVPVSSEDGFFDELPLPVRAETVWTADNASAMRETDDDYDLSTQGDAVVLYLDAPDSMYYRDPRHVGVVRGQTASYADDSPSMMKADIGAESSTVSGCELLRLIAEKHLSRHITSELERRELAASGASFASVVLRESKAPRTNIAPFVSVRILWTLSSHDLASLSASGADDAPSLAREIVGSAFRAAVNEFNAKQAPGFLTLKLTGEDASLGGTSTVVDAPAKPAASSVVMEPAKPAPPPPPPPAPSDAAEKAARLARLKERFEKGLKQ